METERHCSGARSHRGRGEPMAQQSQGTRSRSVTASTSTRCYTKTHRGATGAIARVIEPGGRSLRIPWAGLDDAASGSDDPATVWDHVPSSPLQSPASTHQVQSTKTHPESHSAR